MKPLDPDAVTRYAGIGMGSGDRPLTAREIFGRSDHECENCCATIYPGDCDPDDAMLCAACRGDLDDWRVDR